MNICFFFLSWDYVLNHHYAIRYHISIAGVFIKKVAIITAIHGQNTLRRQLSKFILFGMYNCDFKAIHFVLDKRMKIINKRITKLEMEFEPFIFAINSYPIRCIRFRKKLLMSSLR